MGVDITTYRSRIGQFLPGQDQLTLSVYINFTQTLRTVGSVVFIGLLLLMAGIEPNPGPRTRYGGIYENNVKPLDEDDSPPSKKIKTATIADNSSLVFSNQHPTPSGFEGSILDDELVQCGIDPDNWVNGFAEQQYTHHNFGDSRIRKSGNCSTNTLDSENAVRYTNFRKSQLSDILQKKKEAKRILNELEELRNEDHDRSSTIVEEKEHLLRTILNVPETKWLRSSDGETLDTMVERFQAQFGELDEVLTKEQNIIDLNLVEMASKGLALRGTLVTNNLKHSTSIKQRVLEPPTDLIFFPPELTEIEEVIELASESLSDLFQRSLGTLGHTVAKSIQLLDTQGSKADISSEKGEKFFTKICYALVPTACCEMKLKSLKLTANALFDLQKIESLQRSCSNRDAIQTECERFFRVYGSHVNCGKVHFGGIYEWIAAYNNPKCTTNEVVRPMLEDALNTFASLSCSSFAFNVDNGLSGEQVENQAVFSASHDSSELSKTKLRVLKFGGAIDINTLPLWRYSVIERNGTWAVIDRGNIQTDFKGIWNIVPNHVASFCNAENLSNVLLNAWEKFKQSDIEDMIQSERAFEIPSKTTESEDDCRGTMLPCIRKVGKSNLIQRSDFISDGSISTSQEFSVADKILSRIEQQEKSQNRYQIDPNSQVNERIDNIFLRLNYWLNDSDLRNTCLSYLENLVEEVKQVAEQTGNYEFWTEAIQTNTAVTDFFVKVIDLKTSFKDASDFPFIRNCLKWLLYSVGEKSFKQKEKISKWIDNREYDSLPNVLTTREFSNVAHIITTLHDIFLPEIRMFCSTKSSNEKTQQHTERFITGQLALASHRLLEKLEKSSDIYQLTFFRILLSKLSYNKKIRGFETLLTLKRLETFTDEAVAQVTAIKKHESGGLKNLQAYLVHLAANYIEKSEIIQNKEDYFEELIDPVRTKLVRDIKKSVSKYATKSPFNWLPLLVDMEYMMDGSSSELNSLQLSEKTIENILTPETPDTDYATLSEEESDSTMKFESGNEILSLLALDKYFPAKISLHEVMAVRKDKAPEDLSIRDTPWMILKKLIMLDFRARDDILANIHSLNTKDSIEDADVSLDKIVAELGGENIENQCMHPLDVFLAIFCCCDHMLKQVLVSKMFICKLAVPFIYPLLSSEHLYLSLWPLRTITVICDGFEIPVTKQASKHVTFIRIKSPSFSKSKIMNDLINDSSHDIFFTRDSFPKKTDRVVSDGMAEISWFLPSEKSKGNLNFESVTTFINLRGDAMEHKMQLEFLSKMTDVFVVLVDIANLSDAVCSQTVYDLYKNVQTKTKSVILLLTNKSSKDIKLLLEPFLKNMSADDKRNTKFISTERLGMQRNTADIKRDLKKFLIGFLDGYEGNAIENWGMLVQESGIMNDEFLENCLSGKELAENVLLPLAGENINKTSVKRQMTPLQGNLWGRFTELLKEQMKVGQNSTIHEKDEFQRKMADVRKRQVQVCKNLSPLMGYFISTLIEKVNNKELCLYFLQWLKLDLDEKSRLILPRLYKNYNLARANYRSSRGQDISEATVADLRLNVDKAEQDLADASFGLEHLFREVGQVYEALVDRNTKLAPETKQLAEQLPEIVAKLLIYGQPFELMDGDTANIPLTWVYAVMKHIKKILGNKKMFCLSVLGVQSSGKSTLLNAMFGLQFAVSAGRCTRGIFMQLVPVCKSETELNYDFVLVIDTEGLRAPELAQQKFDHDNKLATLVIGLGDITIINLKGETTAEVEDVLQIAVHAFLRLKMVYQNLQLRQSCVFVHQNVPAQNASDKMACDRQKFLDDLDLKTEEAAQQENIRDIHSFNQVIEFDEKHHVWYFSDLWHGDPPMAPANPGYSRRVAEVKKVILENLAAKRDCFLDVTNTVLHLEDLWRGILKDNFVFSFRNSLEVRAYNKMESVYQELLWKLEEVVFEGVQKKAANELMRCNSSDELLSYKSKSKLTIAEEIHNETYKMKAHLEEFFRTDNLRHILIKWKQTKLLSLRETSEYLIIKARQEIDEMEEQQRIDLLNRTKQIQHEIEINNIASHLADSLKGETPTGQELDLKFNEVWMDWINDRVARVPIKDPCIEKIVKKKVFDRLHDQNHSLSEEIILHPLEKDPKIPCLEGSIKFEDILDDYISLKRTYNDKLPHRSVHTCKSIAIQITDIIMKKLDVIITDLERTDTRFKEAHLSKILNTLIQGIDKHNENADTHQFAFLPPFKVKLAIHVCRYAIQKFKLMNDKYDRKHSTKAKLEAYRDTAYKLFKNIVGQKTEEIIAATFFSERMNALIISTVLSGLTVKVQNDILSNFAHTKFHLILKILDDLASNDNFDDYRSYIDDPYTYAQKWITEYTNEKMFAKQGHDITRFAELAKSHIHKIITCVQKGIDYATQSIESSRGIKIGQWIGHFEEYARKELVLHIGAFKHVTDRTVHDFPHFQRLLLEHLHDIERRSAEYFEKQTAASVTWTGRTPYKKVIDRLWGCEAMCPFCHEPCQKTDKRHIHSGECHTCIQHRPLGVRGTHKDATAPDDSLIVESCNYKVQSDSYFKCSVCRFRCRESGNCTTTEKDETPHKYLEYKTVLPEWDIAPSANMDSSDYWKWFMCTYQNELKETFGVSLSDIPESWRTIDKTSARNSLRVAYNY